MTPERFDPEWLRRTAAAVLVHHGVGAGAADLVADSLVAAELWGHASHGLLRLPWYTERIRRGTVAAAAEPRLAMDGGAVALVDGRNGVGQAVAARAVREAADRAHAHGVGVVGVRSSNHFGTAAYFTRMAARQGCVGLLATNSSPAMPPWGGRDKRIGSNPWSIAVPVGEGRVCVLDISNTMVARGKIYRARERGEPIPDGWAVDADGAPTTDPVRALEGMLLPMGEHKGYGISLMVDMLAGVLTGGGFGSAVNGPYQPDLPGNTGHLAIALDIARFLPAAEFERRARALLAEATSSAPSAPGVPVRYPGELEEEREAENRRLGVALPPATVGSLRSAAADAGVPWEPALR